jgi:thiol peroxidase
VVGGAGYHAAPTTPHLIEEGLMERVGEAFELDQGLTVIGRRLQVGEAAPDFALDYLDPADSQIRPVRLADSAGKVRLLNVVNSLDTPVCHRETHRWDDLRAQLRPEVEVYTISMDLPYAQARWQAAEQVAHPTLSAHRAEAFGRDYGVLIKEWRLLQRAVFVVDGAGRIAHVEYVADQMREPDYDAAVAAANRAAAA